MDDGSAEFGRLIVPLLKRWFVQNSFAPPPDGDLARLADHLWSLVAERGLPVPLAPGECGAPGGMAEAECTSLVARVAGESSDPRVLEVTRQLVKTCFYPEFKICRDSFREITTEGICRRQQLERVRGRLSGAHCVDCPHWTTLSPARHETFLAKAWRADAEEFFAHRDVFLPEDFRALRQWLHARARRPAGGITPRQ